MATETARILATLQQQTRTEDGALLLNVLDGTVLGTAGFLDSKDSKSKVNALATQIYGLVVDSKRLLVAGSTSKTPTEKLKRLVVNIGRKEAIITTDAQYIYCIIRQLDLD